MKRAYVMSGGGVKGAFQLGALHKAINEYKYGDAFFGVSTGSLTAVMMAQAHTHEEQNDQLGWCLREYTEISGNKDIYAGNNNTLAMLVRFLTEPGIFIPTGLKEILAERVNVARVAASPVHFGCGVVQVESGEYFTITNTHPHVLDYVLASASMPAYFPVVNVQGFHYVDGGVRNITPLSEAVNWLAAQDTDKRELYVLLASPLRPKLYGYPMSGPGLLARAFELILNEVYINDLKTLLFYNNLDVEPLEFISVKLVVPILDYGDALDFNPTKIRQMLHDGYNTEPITLEHDTDLREIIG